MLAVKKLALLIKPNAKIQHHGLNPNLVELQTETKPQNQGPKPHIPI
jgi:hypothetical protein